MSQKERVYPHNEDAEKAVIGCVLLDPQKIDILLSEGIRPGDFYKPQTREIYTAFIELQAENKPIDLLTVQEKLKARGTLEIVGGVGALVDIYNEIITAANFTEYINIIKDKSKYRQEMKTAESLYQAAAKEEAEKVSSLYTQLEEIRDGEQTRYKKKLQGYADLFISEQEYRKTENPAKYGLTDLDKVTAGIHRGQLIVIAGRPGSGKSAISLQIADEVQKQGYKTMFCPLEMTAYETLERLILRNNYCIQEELNFAALSDAKKANISKYLNDLEQSKKLVIYEGLNQLDAIIQKVKAEKPYLVVIDQLTQIEPTGNYKDTRERYMQVTRKLKELALNEQIAIILTTQLNRPAEEKKTPTLANLHESDSTGQNADVVLILTIDEEEKNKEQRFKEVSLYVAKQRQGASGQQVHLVYEGGKYKYEPSFKDAPTWPTVRL